ncbi:hypothetical protein [Paraburkholderia xenovorans]
MDRLIAPNSVIAAQADTAPATGTPQFATDGNPATNIPATQWPAYQYNAIQEELIAAIKGAGLTPDRNNNAQLLAAIEALIQASAPVIGSVRNLASGLLAASGTKTVTADQVVVGTSLSGARYCLSGLNLTGNIATQMDTGSAPASGFVAEYVIYNPNAPISGTNPRLLYTNASLAAQPSVYGGANMPAGYTASALISVWKTNGSSQFIPSYQRDREYYFVPVSALSSTTNTGSTLTSLSVSGIVPPNAISLGINFVGTNSVANTGINFSIAGSSTGIGTQLITGTNSTAGSGQSSAILDVPLITPQTVFYTNNQATGVSTVNLMIHRYNI